MAEINAKMVNDLRARTGAGMMDCKKALVETNGDADAAVEVLRKKGAAIADKKAGRTASQGLVSAYIHSNNKVGVLIEVACESDFVAKNADFQSFVKDLCMHIAAVAPICISREEVPADRRARRPDAGFGGGAGSEAERRSDGETEQPGTESPGWLALADAGGRGRKGGGDMAGGVGLGGEKRDGANREDRRAGRPGGGGGREHAAGMEGEVRA